MDVLFFHARKGVGDGGKKEKKSTDLQKKYCGEEGGNNLKIKKKKVKVEELINEMDRNLD